MKQRAIKMPDHLWQRVQTVASMDDLTAAEFVRRTVEEAVHPRCPVQGCTFRALSDAARCSVHGRTVI